MARTFLNKKNVDLNQGYIPKVKFTLFGDWEKVITITQKLGKEIKAAGIYAQLKICEDIVKRVKNHLKFQDLGWVPLNEKYAEKKEKKGLDPGILMSYQTYYNSIEAWKSGNRHLVFAGVKGGIYTKTTNGRRSKLDVATIAAIHEFSLGRRLPRRPLWNPTIAEIGGAPGMKKAYIKHLKGYLRVRGIPVKEYSSIFD